MSHRRPDPSHPGLEQALRHALRVAADSVEPGADGLDRIRGKIAVRPRVVHTGWQTTYLAGLLGVLSTVWRFADPAVIWLRYWTGAVAERFRPDLGRVGWLGWLRPAAAIATGLFVVAGASWAIAALPQAISQSGNSRNIGGAGSSSSAPRSAHHSSQPGGGAQSSRPGHHSSLRPSNSCRASSPARRTSPSTSPSPSSSPSTSSSHSPSPSPSTSYSTTPTASPSPSPSAITSTISPVSVQAIQSALAAGGLQADPAAVARASVTSQAGRTIIPRPGFRTPKKVASPSPGASRRRSPCA